MKAMILAAGRGERMKPLTDHTPKPLLEVHKKPLIFHHLDKLARAGIKDVIINVSYLAEKIYEAVGIGEKFNLNISYSHEPIALETGGGIIQALPLLGEESFLVINSDIFTDFPFESLLETKNNPVHLILVSNPEHHPKGDFSLTNNQVNLVNTPRYTFSGIGVYHPKIFSGFNKNAGPLINIFMPAIQKNWVGGEHYEGMWFDIGTPERLADINYSILKK